MNDILKHWDIFEQPVSKFDANCSTTWNINDKYVLKYNPNSKVLLKSIELANLLSSQGIPVAEYVKTNKGQWVSPNGMYCLMKRLKGSHIDFYMEPKLIGELGKGLAKLHIALLEIEQLVERKDSDFSIEWEEYIKPEIIDLPAKLKDIIESSFLNMYRELPRQIIHRDVHSKNVLFAEDTISGWIDFDISCRNVKIFDIAYFFTGLLLEKISLVSYVDTWKSLCREFLVGYEKVSHLSKLEIRAIPFMMLAVELLFVAFWTKENNSEQREAAVEMSKLLYKELTI